MEEVLFLGRIKEKVQKYERETENMERETEKWERETKKWVKILKVNDISEKRVKEVNVIYYKK